MRTKNQMTTSVSRYPSIVIIDVMTDLEPVLLVDFPEVTLVTKDGHERCLLHDGHERMCQACHPRKMVPHDFPATLPLRFASEASPPMHKEQPRLPVLMGAPVEGNVVWVKEEGCITSLAKVTAVHLPRCEVQLLGFDGVVGTSVAVLLSNLARRRWRCR